MTADKRLTRNRRVEWQYYHENDTIENVKSLLEYALFVIVKSKNQQYSRGIEKVIKDGSTVNPYCGKPHCLQFNPRANLKTASV